MHLTFEAVLSILVLLLVIAWQPLAPSVSLDEVLLRQKQHDLMGKWLDWGETANAKQDIERLFPGRGYETSFGPTKNGGCANKLKERAVYVPRNSKTPEEIWLTICN